MRARRSWLVVHLKTERIAETALQHRDFDQVQLDFPELGGYFTVPEDSKLTPDGLGFQ